MMESIKSEDSTECFGNELLPKITKINVLSRCQGYKHKVERETPTVSGGRKRMLYQTPYIETSLFAHEEASRSLEKVNFRL